MTALHDARLEEDQLEVDGYRAPATSGASQMGSAEEKSLSHLHAEHCCLLRCEGKQLDRQLTTGSQAVASSWLAGQGLGKNMTGKLVAKKLGKEYVDELLCVGRK